MIRRFHYLALALLTVWDGLYELSVTVWPALTHTIVADGIAPDVLSGSAGLLLLVAGLRRWRGWALFGLGTLCWSAGDVYWTLKLSNMSTPPVPSWADAGYLLFCPLAVVGMVLLLRRRVRRAPAALVFDSLAAALAVGSVSGAVVLDPVLHHASGGPLASATNLAYPLVDLLLLALIVGAFALNSWRPDRTWTLLGLAVVAFWVADSLYLVTVASNSYQSTAWFNPLWYLAPVLMGWAAWLPHGESRTIKPSTGRRGIVMPLLFALVALGVLVWASAASIGVVAVVMAALSLLVVMGRLGLTWRENAALLHASQAEALSDALTGLANRRALSLALAERLEGRAGPRPALLALFDLDGFKHYNDTFGHPAGDALLARLARKLRGGVPTGTAYRIGGDEFCVLVDDPGDPLGTVSAAVQALSERGEGFAISASYGSVLLGEEAQSPSEALRIADQRMYAQKHSRRTSASSQSRDVLLRALAERNPELGAHVHDVGELARDTATALGLADEAVEEVAQAAELHDVGKMAVPDAILDKPGPLNDAEWEFIRRHTLIGQRIIAAAPALGRVAELVRSSHENFDGTGYPDRLRGQDIPLGSRIISVCDAYDAMTSDRAYRRAMPVSTAMAELRRCAGSQFDPEVVERFCAAIEARLQRDRAAV